MKIWEAYLCASCNTVTESRDTCPSCLVAPCDHGRAMCFECMEDAVLQAEGKGEAKEDKVPAWKASAAVDWEEGR